MLPGLNASAFGEVFACLSEAVGLLEQVSEASAANATALSVNAMVKNFALARLHLASLAGVAASDPRLGHALPEKLKELLQAEANSKATTSAAVAAIGRFLAEQPNDRDAGVFKSALASLSGNSPANNKKSGTDKKKQPARGK